MKPSDATSGRWRHVMAPNTPAWAQGPVMTIIPSNVDLQAIESDLADDHVSAPSDLVPQLSAVVSKAADKGHEMNFVVLTDAQPKFTYFRDIAAALQKDTGGTVVVFGPNSVGSASDDFSRVQLEQAQDNLTTSKPTVAAQQILDRMTDQTQVPWTVVTVLLVVVVALGAVAARIVGRRRSVDRDLATTAAAPTDIAISESSGRIDTTSSGEDI